MNASPRKPSQRDTPVDSRPALLQALRRLGLATADEAPDMVPLTGGVSSDIWRVDLATGPVCVKRALPQLKAAEVWKVPVERNSFEAEWMRVVSERVPGCTPRLIAEDRSAGLFVMEYLEPGENRIWKSVLSEGEADSNFAGQVGSTIAKIHSATAGDEALARRFDTVEIFRAIRLEPYLTATGRRHPDLSSTLNALAERTAGARIALVHGDVSPKNILDAGSGPVILDAECAWYGDPAFDLAFCLKHMLLKGLWVPAAAEAFLDCYRALAAAYISLIDWESPAAFEERAASLLPALFLARVDGKSPVEYLTSDSDKERVRVAARAMLLRPPMNLDDISDAWRREVVA